MPNQAKGSSVSFPLPPVLLDIFNRLSVTFKRTIEAHTSQRRPSVKRLAPMSPPSGNSPGKSTDRSLSHRQQDHPPSQPSYLMYTPGKCLHCRKEHTPSQAHCGDCTGFTLPTRGYCKNGGGGFSIQWDIFELHPSSSDAAKATLMRSAMIAMQKNLNVAVFGYNFLDGSQTLQTVLLTYSPRREEEILRYSFRKTKSGEMRSEVRAHPRLWSRVCKEEWQQFVHIVGGGM